MLETMHTVTCDHCGVVVDVRGSDPSLVYVTRDAVAGDPRSFLIIAKSHEQDSLLHSCTDEA